VSILDLATLLQPVPGDAPCGRDLEYAPEMMEMMTLAAEPDEAAFKGIEVVDSRNWAGVRSRAERLVGQTKDVRVSALLTRALLHTDGIPGFCQGISLTVGMTERFWDGLHPALDGTDAIARLNAFGELWSRPTLAALRSVPLVSVKGLGDFSLRDVLISRGQEKPRGDAAPPSPQHVQRALDTAPDLAGTAEAVRGALGDLAKLETLVRERAPGHSFDPSSLREQLVAMQQVLPRPAAGAPSPEPTARAGESPHAASAAQGEVVYREREVQSRDDVLAMLDKICSYYERNEPSSPVPLLMQRARRLVTMNFVDLIRDLADKGMPQIEAIAGKESKP
jgi:type VI secretion system protein ImpA